MKDIIFKRTELEDKEIMTKYFDEHPSRSCERTFVNVFLWSRQYPVKWAIVEGAMVFKSEDEGHVAYAFPAGTDEHVKRALDKMKTYSEERGYPFRMYNVTPDDFARLESWYPGRFEIEYDRDEADYVYESEKLATLSGKKMHGKKNHVNRFRKEFEGRWSYESMKKETVNLSNVEEMGEFEVKSNLFLIENPSVFLYLVDRLKEYADNNNISKDLIRERFPILICTSGCFQTAVLEYVRKCIERNSKCRVYFSGDFDRAGIEMMEKMKEYFPKNVSPFQMNAKTYLSGLDGKCRNLTEKDREILAGKSSELARLMALHGKKVYQESIASDLWEVLLREIQCVETISYQTYGKGENAMENRKIEIFLSYCWQDEKIASDIYSCLSKIPNVNIHKDTIDIKKWDSIKKYMYSIGNMDYTILLISDAYLRSRNCMYEVLELMRDRMYKDKIFPAVVSKEIYNPVVVANYVKYWQDEQQQLEAQLSNLRIQNLGSLHQKLKMIQDIASNTADFLDLIGDMNNPDIDVITIEISKKLAEWGVIPSEK